MRVNVKHMIEIAGGLVIGIFAIDAVDGVGKLSKKAVVKSKEKIKEKMKASKKA